MEKQSNVRIMFNGNSGKVTVIAKGEKKHFWGVSQALAWCKYKGVDPVIEDVVQSDVKNY